MALYFGDLHSHAFCGRQFSDAGTDLATARSHLDFFAATEHAIGQKKNEERFPDYWPEQRRRMHEANRPGEFATILGWEWADVEGLDCGDMCVYFPDDAPDPMPVPRSYDDMVAFVRERNAILIPHHVGYMPCYPGTNWDKFDPAVMPVVEVFSMHGSNEREGGPFPMNLALNGPRSSGGTVVEGLDRGLRFGFIGSTDQHVGYPGAYPQGLAAVFAPQLSRSAIWDALKARRCYAVTGDRIRLEFNVNGVVMGGQTSDSERSIELCVSGEDMLDQVDVVKNGRLWKRLTRAFESPTAVEGRFMLRVEWGWGGGGETFKWENHLAVQNGRILRVTPHFGPPVGDGIAETTADECRWESVTLGSPELGSYFRNQMHTNTGGTLTKQLVFEIEGSPDATMTVTANGREWSFQLTDLNRGSAVWVVAGDEKQPIGARKIKLHRAVPQAQYQITETILDTEPENDVDYYYLRIRQDNGQMAWSSPVWCEG